MDDGRTIILVEEIPYSPARVWRVLTDPTLMADWLMPNDFVAQVGHEFTFKGMPQPNVGFSGTVRCKVIELVPEKRLSLSWKDDTHEGEAPWTVTWTLQQHGEGTQLTLVHDGFDPADGQEQLSRKIMMGGWPAVLRRIGAVAGGDIMK